MIIERKIGEIFECGGEWYQCVESIAYCPDCAFSKKACPHSTLVLCDAIRRKDKKNVIFKKLEKVGEPITINGTLVQKMKTPVAIGCEQCVLNNKGCSIIYEKCFSNELYVIKQSQEDMEEKELNLKEFNLEAAKSGKPVCTRDGRKARIICFDAKRKDEKNIIALVPSKDYPGFEDLISYPNNGNYYGGHENDGDLMMLPEKKEGWVNVYKGGLLDTKSYPTKKEAFDKACPEGYIDTIKISWEE